MMKSRRPTASKVPIPPRNMSPLAREIAEGLTNALAHARGEDSGARVTTMTIPEPAPVFRPTQIRAIRKRLGLTQSSFARLMNVSVKSIEGWESGAKSPGPASRRLLQITGDEQTLAVIAKAAGYRLVKRS